MPSFVPFSLLVASIGVAVMIYFLVRGTAAADTALKARAVAEVNVLANRVAASVEVNQGKDAELQLDPVRNDADLVYLQILRSDGTVFARYPSKEGPKAADSVQPAKALTTEIQGELLHVRVPLRVGKNQIGTLGAWFSRSSVLEEQVRLLGSEILISLILLFIFVVASLFIPSRSIE